jgi:hypothetical protein
MPQQMEPVHAFQQRRQQAQLQQSWRPLPSRSAQGMMLWWDCRRLHSQNRHLQRLQQQQQQQQQQAHTARYARLATAVVPQTATRGRQHPSRMRQPPQQQQQHHHHKQQQQQQVAPLRGSLVTSLVMTQAAGGPCNMVPMQGWTVVPAPPAAHLLLHPT